MKCKNCFNLEKMKDYARGDVYDWCIIKHDNPDTDMERDCPFYKPRTNYDCIVSKTPEELAKFMGELPCCPPGADVKELCYPMDSCEGTDLQVQCWLDWLKKEAD